MKSQADKNRSERSFAIGDQVYIKLQPYVQSSVARRACHKLSFRYFGPFPIVDRIGQVAYKVALPEASTIHPVFHVSLLRKALKPTDQVSAVLPNDTNQFMIPVQVLERRQKNKANRVVDQVRVKWSSETMPCTWEDLDELQSRFPYAAAWGQAAPEEEGGVNTTTASGPLPPPSPRPTRERRPNPRYKAGEWEL